MKGNIKKGILIACLAIAALCLAVSMLLLNTAIHSKKWEPIPAESSSNDRQFHSSRTNGVSLSDASTPLTLRPSRTDADTPTQEVSPTFDNIKRMLDLSMQRVGASYVGHQPILRYSDKAERLSFVYQKGDGTTGCTIQELAETAGRGLRGKIEGANRMSEARAQNSTNMIREAARLQVQANRDIYQTEQCFTVEMNSSTNAPPLTMFQKGIPEWLVYRQTAFTLASNYLLCAPQLVEVAQVAPFSEAMFTFTDSAGRHVYVKPRSAQVFTNVTIGAEPANTPRRSPDEKAAMQARISQQWTEFMQRGIDVNQFNLSDLTDLSKKK